MITTKKRLRNQTFYLSISIGLQNHNKRKKIIKNIMQINKRMLYIGITLNK